MKTVTYTRDNFLLKDGDVTIIEISYGAEYPVATTNKETSELYGIPHLKRELFVKPVDVRKAAIEHHNSYYKTEFIEGSQEEFLLDDFFAGYNFAMANSKGEFTREEAEALFNEGCRQGSGYHEKRTFDDCVAHLRPLSLPKSIQVIDNNWNNPKIVW